MLKIIIIALRILWFKFILGLKFFELVSILFAIVPDYGNEYTTKENKNWTSFKIFAPNKQLRRPETVEVGCPRHPGATTIGNQLQDGDRTDGWPNLTTQPWAPTA